MRQPSIMQRPDFTPPSAKYRLEFRASTRDVININGQLSKGRCVVEAPDVIGQPLLDAHEKARKQIGPCRLVKVVKAGEA